MFSPPEEMHTAFDGALARMRNYLGHTHALYIDGADALGASLIDDVNPANTLESLGRFASAGSNDVDAAVAAAARAHSAWRDTEPAERARLSRRVSALIEERVYEIAAALCLEVGKTRMEGLGEAQETADFFSGYARMYESNGFYDRALPDDPLREWRSRNRSVLKPYGVWAVIAPFNFPLALAGGPTAAALITGNCVVLKSSIETPWAGRILAECIRDAGYPAGVFNYIVGDGERVGASLLADSRVAGVTFTGSHEVGMSIHRAMLSGDCPRPCIAEMGGKNACIVTRHADLQRALPGIVRSAFGLSGQKYSAVSRIYVERSMADDLIVGLCERMRKLNVTFPTERGADLGPVISMSAAQNFERYSEELRTSGARIWWGGERLLDASRHLGAFCAPTLAEAEPSHRLFSHEMFVPIVMLSRVENLNEAIGLANASSLGLAAGFYGNAAEAEEFRARIEAGTIYINRPQGATTGAWPGYQAFGGWKGSSCTGKAIGSFYYLPQYLREQSQTTVE